jgi:hypothetical protein
MKGTADNHLEVGYSNRQALVGSNAKSVWSEVKVTYFDSWAFRFLPEFNVARLVNHFNPCSSYRQTVRIDNVQRQGAKIVRPGIRIRQ